MLIGLLRSYYVLASFVGMGGKFGPEISKPVNSGQSNMLILVSIEWLEKAFLLFSLFLCWTLNCSVWDYRADRSLPVPCPGMVWAAFFWPFCNLPWLVGPFLGLRPSPNAFLGHFMLLPKYTRFGRSNAANNLGLNRLLCFSRPIFSSMWDITFLIGCWGHLSCCSSIWAFGYS